MTTISEPGFALAVAFSPPRTSLELAITLLNTWDLLAHPPELLRDPEALRRYLAWTGRPTDRTINAEDVARVVAARTVLRQAIEAPNLDQTVGLLNALAIGAGAVRELRKVDDGWRFTYLAANADPCGALIAEAAEGALGAIVDGEWDRLGVCAGDPCRCVYVDQTKNRSRRYCCQLCTNRTTQARFRERRRSGATAHVAPVAASGTVASAATRMEAEHG